MLYLDLQGPQFFQKIAWLEKQHKRFLESNFITTLSQMLFEIKKCWSSRLTITISSLKSISIEKRKRQSAESLMKRNSKRWRRNSFYIQNGLQPSQSICWEFIMIRRTEINTILINKNNCLDLMPCWQYKALKLRNYTMKNFSDNKQHYQKLSVWRSQLSLALRLTKNSQLMEKFKMKS